MKKLWVVVLVSTMLFIGACSSPSEEQATQSDQEEVVVDEVVSEDIEEEDTEEEDDDEATNALGDRLSTAYVDMMSSGEYTMKYKSIVSFEGEEIESDVTIAMQNESMAFSTVMDGMNYATILDSEKYYIIDHQSKTVMSMPMNQEAVFEENPSLNIAEATDLEYMGTGKATFLDEEMTYEEYATGQDKIIYYFDDDELVGMEMISETASVSMVIEEFTDQVDESMFEVPEDYQVVEIGS